LYFIFRRGIRTNSPFGGWGLGLHLQDLSFRYGDPTTDYTLTDITLTIPAGKTTAIVGESGSGKTTLLKLLLKFYEPQKGEIAVGNTSLQLIDSSWWRSRVGTLMQDGFIFSDTIAKNIALGEEEIDTERLAYAVKTANISEYIASLPLGYHTKIGSEGTGLSGGQRQRILIARAVYKNPDYIFFDEATSALDANNEKVIMENLQQFFTNRTVIIIAHRLSTVKNADQIVVLEKGKLVEVGNHATLVAQKGKYFELVKNQLELGE